jgi:hypothetical protein
MYFKVVKKNSQEKNNSTLYLLVSSGNENFVSPSGDSTLWNSSQAFLNSFVEKTTAYSLEQDIADQEKLIKNGQDNLGKLQKRERELSGQLLKNQEDQKAQQGNIENQNRILADMKLKRKV